MDDENKKIVKNVQNGGLSIGILQCGGWVVAMMVISSLYNQVRTKHSSINKKETCQGPNFTSDKEFLGNNYVKEYTYLT